MTGDEWMVRLRKRSAAKREDEPEPKPKPEAKDNPAPVKQGSGPWVPTPYVRERGKVLPFVPRT